MANPIQGLSVPDLSSAAPAAAAGKNGQSEFFDVLQGAMGQVEQLRLDAQAKVAAMLDGSGEDVHSAMAAVEKAGLAFEMMVQVRNKIVQAYETISQISL